MTSVDTEPIAPSPALTVKPRANPTNAVHTPATKMARCFRVIRNHADSLVFATPSECHESIGLASWLGADLLATL